MSNQLFDRANRIGLDHVKSWLPDGHDDGGEWVALNPTREDRTAGSFKVNLSSGAWLDNATDDRGGDAVSLYAYLHRSECETAAASKGYHNVAGGIQSEAARAILESYDQSYFPSDRDDFTPSSRTADEKGDTWDGFSYKKGDPSQPLPAFDASWYEKKWGKFSERWDFYDGAKKPRFIFAVMRFIDSGKKSDRPFTLWQKGTLVRWRAKRPDCDYPLWNLGEILERPTAAVVLCEGQKAASRGKACAGLSEYVFTGWYGGAGNTRLSDWSPLRGRTVYFWPDADNPGRDAIKAIRTLATELDIQLSVVHPPVGKPKGWDIADAITDGLSVADILSAAPAKAEEPAHYLDDLALPFDIVGVSGSDIIFYPHGSNRIERYRASALTKNALLTLADRKVWGTYYAKGDGGIAWDAAINDVIRRSETAPVFNFARVRGGGAWMDDGEVVINTGEYLIVNGQRRELHERVGRWMYEKRSYTPYRAEEPLPTEASKALLEITTHIKWSAKAAPYALAGWLLLAPWGGVLRWRPHIWLVGPRGTGKSWLLERIVEPVVIREFGEKGDGKSTPAGVRQKLASSSKPFMGDEMESDNPKYAEYIEQNLSLFRSASSGIEGGTTLMGTADGEGQQWIMQSMACFASIGAAIRHGADMDRFTVCELSPSRKRDIAERDERFRTLERMVDVLTPEWCKAFHARTYSIIGELLRCIDVMAAAASAMTGSMRQGDQLGTLMAGAWMVDHDSAPLASEAKAWLESLDILSLRAEGEEKTDEEQCLDEILSHRIEVSNRSGRQKITIGAAIQYWFEKNLDVAADQEFPAITAESLMRELVLCGIKPCYVNGQPHLKIAIAHPELRKALRDSGWGNTYSAMLQRLDTCDPVLKGPERFGGIQKRYMQIALKKIGEDAPF